MQLDFKNNMHIDFMYNIFIVFCNLLLMLLLPPVSHYRFVIINLNMLYSSLEHCIYICAIILTYCMSFIIIIIIIVLSL